MGNVIDLERKKSEMELKKVASEKGTTATSLSHWPKSILDAAVKSLKE